MNIYNSLLRKKLCLPPSDPKMHCEPRGKLEMSTIDILGPRLPTHTWRGRHMHEDSRWRRQPGKNIRNSITNYRFLGFFDGLTASDPLPLDFFESRTLLRRF